MTSRHTYAWGLALVLIFIVIGAQANGDHWNGQRITADNGDINYRLISPAGTGGRLIITLDEMCNPYSATLLHKDPRLADSIEAGSMMTDYATGTISAGASEQSFTASVEMTANDNAVYHTDIEPRKVRALSQSLYDTDLIIIQIKTMNGGQEIIDGTIQVSGWAKAEKRIQKYCQ